MRIARRDEKALSCWLLAGLAFSMVGCGHVTKLRPTEAGAVALEAAVGGPLVKVGSIVAVAPMTSVGASYGVAERFDVGAHLHPTSLAFGVVGLDLGGSWLALHGDGLKPTLTISSLLYGFAGLRGGFRPYLELTSAASWTLGRRWSVYGSASALGQLSAAPLWALGAGAELRLGRGAVQLEIRWYDPHVDSEISAVEWISPARRGAIGLVLGGRLAFGEKEAAP